MVPSCESVGRDERTNQIKSGQSSGRVQLPPRLAPHDPSVLRPAVRCSRARRRSPRCKRHQRLRIKCVAPVRSQARDGFDLRGRYRALDHNYSLKINNGLHDAIRGRAASRSAVGALTTSDEGERCSPYYKWVSVAHPPTEWTRVSDAHPPTEWAEWVSVAHPPTKSSVDEYQPSKMTLSAPVFAA